MAHGFFQQRAVDEVGARQLDRIDAHGHAMSDELDGKRRDYGGHSERLGLLHEEDHFFRGELEGFEQVFGGGGGLLLVINETGACREQQFRIEELELHGVRAARWEASTSCRPMRRSPS